MPLSTRFHAIAIALALAMACALAGCSPTFNWREVPIGSEGVIVLLPCKPDRATRALPLGVEAVTVDMAGCEAGGATFAVAHAVAGSPAQAEGWARAWRAATRSQLAGAPATEVPAELPRAASTPAPVRLDTPEAGGGLHVLWFAQQRPDGVSLYQATVLGRPSSAEALATFFEGVRVP